ncbi:hypothetical protein D6779_01020, partial [Candidatus Parcubacteria bacterium]
SEQARKWSETPEDVEVATGEYSAKHWARKAAQHVANGVIDDTTVSDVTTFSSSRIAHAIRAYKLPAVTADLPSVVAVNSVVPNGTVIADTATSVVLFGVELTVAEPLQISTVMLSAHVFDSDAEVQGDTVAFSPVYVISSVSIPNDITFQVFDWAFVI